MNKHQPTKPMTPAPPIPEPNCHGYTMNGNPVLYQNTKAIFPATYNIHQT